MPRLKGHVRDKVPHPQARHHSALLGASITVPPVMQLPARIPNQRGENCTNFGYGWLPDTWCQARGLACAEISHRAPYTLGRMITAANPNAPLVDDGAIPSDVIEGMRTIGVVPETEIPGDGPDVINQRLDFGELEAMATWQVTGIGLIQETGAERCAAIRRAIASQFPVGFGMEVDQAYEELAGDTVYTGLKGAGLGGHAQRIVGYRPGAFCIAGSWGLGFAASGFAWISDDFIGDADVCFDFYLVSAAPVVKDGAA